MIKVLPIIDNVINIEYRSVPIQFNKEIEAVVNACWNAAKKRCPNLFNGSGFTVDEIQGSKIIGRKVEYKYYFAQQEIPELVEALDIALLGVSGILRCPQGWVFGRRAQTVTEYPGVWELVPSGNIDASYIMTDSTTAVRQQLFTELKEEVGLAAEDIVATRLQVMVVDAKAHAIDIGVMLDTNLAFENILQAQQRLGSLEYDALQVISFEGLNDFFEDYPVLEASKCFLNSIDHAAGS